VKSVNFSITSPEISFAQARVEFLTNEEIPITFITSEETISITYSLDGSSSQTVDDNFTLSNLPQGHHSLRVYATDIVGNNGTSDELYFSVKRNWDSTIMLPFAVAITVIAIVSIITVIFILRAGRKRISARYFTFSGDNRLFCSKVAQRVSFSLNRKKQSAKKCA
jgi:hypothetical protein